MPSASPSSWLARLRLILALAGLAFLGVAAYEWSTMRDVRASLLSSQKKYQSDLRDLLRVENRIRERDTAAGQRASASTAHADSIAAKDGTSGMAGESSAPAEGRQRAQQFLARFPEARAMMTAFAKAEFDLKYRPFFKTAHLSPAQVDSLERATVEAEMQSLTIGDGSGSAHPTVAAAPDDQALAILGYDAYQAYKDYRTTIPLQTLANNIAAKSDLAGYPMSVDQMAILAQLMVRNAQRDTPSATFSRDSVNWSATLQQMQAVLPPDQYAVALRVLTPLQYQQALAQAQKSAQPAKPPHG
jgi:hypothetical protein